MLCNKQELETKLNRTLDVIEYEMGVVKGIQVEGKSLGEDDVRIELGFVEKK